MKWGRFFRRDERSRELAAEMEFHLAEEIEDNLARGLAPEAARLAARRKLGNAALIHEDVYRMDAGRYLEPIWQDVRYAWRTLGKNRVFAVTALLTLALGIGGNTAIFTVIRAVLLKPLEYHEADRLVTLTLENPTVDSRELPLTKLRFDETRSTARSFTAMGSYLRTPENMALSGGGEPEVLQGARVSANFLEIVGVKPAIGRSFRTEEDAPGGEEVAMISAGLWARRFGRDPQIAGRSMIINAIPYTIIGVLPDGFVFPFAKTDVWVTRPSEWSFVPSRVWTFVTTQIGFARLRTGVTFEQAQAEMKVINRQYLHAHPERVDAKPGVIPRISPLKERMISNVRPMLWILFGAVGLVLLIACANLAALLLARAASRSREFAVRAALGAGRGRLARQLLMESLLLSAGGGALGALLANWSLAAVPSLSALVLPRAQEIRVDGMVLAFTIAISVATGLIFGLLPSFEVTRANPAEALRQGGAGSGLERRRGWLALSPRGVLVVGQVALSIVLLIGAALLIQSFARLRNVDPGFEAGRLLTAKIPLPVQRYDTNQKRITFLSQLQQSIAATPGVRSAAIVKSIPTTPWIFTNVSVAGITTEAPREQPSAQLQAVSADYFTTMGIPIRRGRGFAAQDNVAGARPVAIINESLARKFWPAYPAGPNPIGQLFGEGADKLSNAEIIGVAADVHEGGLWTKPGLEFYVPLTVHAPQIAYLAVRTTNDGMAMGNIIRNAVKALDADQPVSDLRSMEEVFDATLGQRRLTMQVLGVFAGSALLLAMIGLYGAIAYSVVQRTQEVGIRRALGADRPAVLRLVLREALGLTIAGVLVGLGGAYAFSQVMKTLVFDVSTTDPTTFAGIAAAFVVVAVAASWVPAWRAARIDPLTALR